MPLRDHFHSPLADVASWEGFHGGWPMVIVQQLGKRLPARYVAEPRVHSGTQIEVGVAAYDRDRSSSVPSTEGNGGVATAVWAPTTPTLSVETELPDSDEYEVRIYDAKRARRLVAAVEIVSPANKDRPEHRALFLAKCAALLQQQVCVAIVDLVTSRHFHFYAALLDMLGQKDPDLEPDPPALYAVSCRWGLREVTHRFEAWHYALHVDRPLPTLPLWLSDDLAVPLELEASYEQTCRDLRIGLRS